MHPSTPCSASSACGGNRSTRVGSATPELRRRPPRKSFASVPPAESTVVIMVNITPDPPARGNERLLKMLTHYSLSFHNRGRTVQSDVAFQLDVPAKKRMRFVRRTPDRKG